MGMIIKNEMPIKELLTIDDLKAGEVFMFDGDDRIYMMIGCYGWFVHLPSGNVIENPYHADWCNRPVTTIDVELIVKST